MARTKGAINKMTRDVKAAVEQAFKTVNGKNNAGLIKLSKEQPAIFYGLVAKCIPTAVAVDIKASIDLAGAMLASQEQLQTLQANNEIKTIEHLTPDTLSPDNVTPDKEIADKPQKTADPDFP